MENFSYVDIFATKGIEYLCVIGFLVALVLFWRTMRPAPTPALATSNTAGRRPAPAEWFYMMEGLHYHPGHSWAKENDNEIVTVGLDDFAQKLLGKPDGVDLPPVGSYLDQGGTGWKLSVHSKPIEMLSPVTGEVVEINQEVTKSPELISKDPYGKGWLMKVRVPKSKPGLRNLLSGRIAGAWMNETVRSLRERMSGELGMVLQDGGEPVSGFAMSLSPDEWDKIAAEYLRTN